MAAAPWIVASERDDRPSFECEGGAGQEECVRLLVDDRPFVDCGRRGGRASRWTYLALSLIAALLLAAALTSVGRRPLPFGSAAKGREFQLLEAVPDADMMRDSNSMKEALQQADQAVAADLEQVQKDEEAKRIVREAALRKRRQEQEVLRKQREEVLRKQREEELRKQRVAKKRRREAAKLARQHDAANGTAANGTSAPAGEAARGNRSGGKQQKEKTFDFARSIFMEALDDLLHPPKTEAHGFKIVNNGTCQQKGLFPIQHAVICPRAAAALVQYVNATTLSNKTGRPEGCFMFKGKLWFSANVSNTGMGGTSDMGQICMTKARKQHEAAWYAGILKQQADELAAEKAAAEAKLAAEKAAAEAKRKAEEEARRKEEKERLAELERRRKEAEEREKRKEAEELREHYEQEERIVLKWEQAEETVPNVTLYCFSLMMPFGYEPDLLTEQRAKVVGIFACDQWTVFSNVSTLMDGEASPVPVSILPCSLEVPLGGRWMTALNTGVFNRLWMEVIRAGIYRYNDWTVKVDPDAVFFPDRLRQLLRHKTPYNEEQVRRRVPEPSSLSCGTCRLQGKEHETCSATVRALQQQGHTCKDALELTARDPPTDCGCHCDDFACDLPGSAIYLNNCQWGLHGPIEVLSRRAVATYVAGLPKCVDLMEHSWGEDKFVDQCMQQLGVTRADEYSLLSETACGDQPAPCGTSKVAFHPFKSIPSYFACHEYAREYGEGPAAVPRFADLEAAGIGVDQILANVANLTTAAAI